MKKLTQEQVNDMIVLHAAWLDGDENGVRADFSNVNLARMRFNEYNFNQAIFKNVNLEDAEFYNCDLGCTDFTNAHLRDSIIINCNLKDANFKDANMMSVTISSPKTYYIHLENAYTENLKIDNNNKFKEKSIKGMTEQDFIIHTLEKNGTNIDEIRELYQKMKSFGYV